MRVPTARKERIESFFVKCPVCNHNISSPRHSPVWHEEDFERANGMLDCPHCKGVCYPPSYHVKKKKAEG